VREKKGERGKRNPIIVSGTGGEGERGNVWTRVIFERRYPHAVIRRGEGI